MLKSRYIDVYFNSEDAKIQRNEFDTWFESQDWTDTSSQELINMADEFVENSDDDVIFGKNGNEEEYINSVLDYLYEVQHKEENNLENMKEKIYKEDIVLYGDEAPKSFEWEKFILVKRDKSSANTFCRGVIKELSKTSSVEYKYMFKKILSYTKKAEYFEWLDINDIELIGVNTTIDTE